MQNGGQGGSVASAAAGTTTIASVPLSSTIPAIVQQAYQENSMQLDHGIHASGPNGVNTSMPNGTSTVQNRNDQTATNNVASSSAATKPSEESVTGLDLTLYCGPLLNYRRMSGAQSNNPIWHGTVLVVTSPPSSSIPADAAASSSTASRLPLTLRCIGPVASATAANGTGVDASHTRRFTPILLYQDKDKAFWRYELEVPIQQFEARWEYNVGAGLNDDARQITGQRVKRVFAVQARSQSMRIMFHSCNGFSVGTDEHAWNGPALWNDVLRMHDQQPFHVMIGGGDQIYNDSVRVDGPLREWTEINNPTKRRKFPFTEEFRLRNDEYYYENYAKWYSLEPFATANGQIAQLNIWDDHDIIDGFGSYVDGFMRCAVFRGIGGVAHKYYMLFQHHVAPPKSTFTTDDPNTVAKGKDFTTKHGSEDPTQAKNTYVYTEKSYDESYIIGPKPGPYVEEHSRSIFCQLGARIAFLGIDGRTERTRHQITYPETYDLIFQRVDKELAANKDMKHLILLLGIPVAYPRLQWLENVLRSPIIGPLRFLNRRFGIAGGMFNQFDGSIDILDDLDDHFTAHQHKPERNQLIHRLQDLARRYSVRVTILSGDVHLAAIGRFFTRPKEGVPIECDHRYMVNVVSSAITNKPPPNTVANLLARRNKIHRLDHNTYETLLETFNHDPGHGHEGKDQQNHAQTDSEVVDVVAAKTASSNHVTMPSRNYAILNEILPDNYIATADAASAGTKVGTNTNGTSNPTARGTTNGAAPFTNGDSTLYSTTTTVSANGHAVPDTNPKGTTAAAAAGTSASSDATPQASDAAQAKQKHHFQPPQAFQTGKVNPRFPLHIGEKGAGTRHPAAPGLRPGAGTSGGALAGNADTLNVKTNSDLTPAAPTPLTTHRPELEFGLDLSIRVEISRDDADGRTQGYGMSIPALEALSLSAGEAAKVAGVDGWSKNAYGTGAGFSVGKKAMHRERNYGGPGMARRTGEKVDGA